MKNIKKMISNINFAFENKRASGLEVVKLDMKKQVYAFTMDSIGAIGFGVDFKTLNEDEVAPFSRAFDEVLQAVSYRGLSPGWEVFPWLYKHESVIKRGIKVLNEFCEDIITQRREDKHIEKKGDILSLFMQADESLSSKFLRDIIMSFMIAGRDVSC